MTSTSPAPAASQKAQKSTVNATPDVHVEFPEFAPTAIPVLDAPIVGRFTRLMRGPENKFGTPFIIEFVAESGSARQYVDGDIKSLEKGTTYTLWLVHEVLLNHFKEARPAVGERFAIKYKGKVLTKDAARAGEQPTNDNTYHGYAFVMPDREVIAAELSWDEVPTE